MKIVISGLGLMGGSLAMALRQNRPDVRIYGYDLAPVLTEARQMGLIDQSIEHWPAGCADADVIFLCTPLKTISRQIKELNGVIKKDTVVTDTGSTKTELVRLVQTIDFSGTYIGGHPMTGAEKSGLKASNPLLYENAIYILTNINEYNKTLAEGKLLPLLESIKARALLLDAVAHDRIMAAISHLPQIIAVALVNLIGQKENEQLPYFELAAGGFRDLTRIASSPFDIWSDIIDSNKENIAEVLKDFIAILEQSDLNLDNLEKDFERANSYRERLPKKNKGFLSPLVDVLVYVTDQVGVISKISNALADKDIDIRDIELLKIREKEGGVFRLSFSNVKEAQTAVNVLNSVNFRAYIRE
ncbi:MAG TPA: prephenate dehydrogenase/arogenate dehydrogenase family protein [Caldithrix abyssi]|uniref:Prephenate dehydrogenase n=1 Tax=Caldithrix abyssi TaxID=187145 RepID=A0A7V4WWZ1_CALAY|nr:prephenate dehydrogenase/arogenate dehydrogenase family protein [Caldithrix abyssi]